MRIAFAGTPEFAQVALKAMIEHGFKPAVVLTQPDRPAGRGMRLQASPVKALAVEQEIPVLQPQGLKLDGRYAEDAAQAQAKLSDFGLDVMVVAAYGLILPAWMLELPRFGCLNIHASLLPRWRGAAPIHRAIEQGDSETGISIMQMDEGLDTGAVISRQSSAIDPDETTGELHDRLSLIGGHSIVQDLVRLQKSQAKLAATAQASKGVTYAQKISREESWLDWQLPANVLHNRIRAFVPFPGAQSMFQRSENLAFTDAGAESSEIVKVWTAKPEPLNPIAAKASGNAPAGAVLEVSKQEGILVACGQSTALRLLALQRPNGKRLPVHEFLNGYAVSVGDRFLNHQSTQA